MLKSVSGKIAITIVALLLVSFALLSLASFSLAKFSIVTSVAHGKQESVKNAENFINAYFESKLHFVEQMAQDIAQSGDMSYGTVAKKQNMLLSSLRILMYYTSAMKLMDC